MKNILKNIGVFFKKKQNTSVEKASSNPYRDWGVICAVSTVIFILVVAGNVYFFMAIQKGKFFANEEEYIAPGKKISAQKLEEALDLMSEREDNFNDLKIKRTTISDPSI